MSPESSVRSDDEWLIFADTVPGGVAVQGDRNLIRSLVSHLRNGWKVTHVSWDEINLHHAGDHPLIKQEAVRTFKRRPAGE